MVLFGAGCKIPMILSHCNNFQLFSKHSAQAVTVSRQQREAPSATIRDQATFPPPVRRSHAVVRPAPTGICLNLRHGETQFTANFVVLCERYAGQQLNVLVGNDRRQDSVTNLPYCSRGERACVGACCRQYGPTSYGRTVRVSYKSHNRRACMHLRSL